jgi:hypothetical protein
VVFPGSVTTFIQRYRDIEVWRGVVIVISQVCMCVFFRDVYGSGSGSGVSRPKHR